MESESSRSLTTADGRPIEPLDPAIRTIQPGGGTCMRIELAWGFIRRAYLKLFRRGYLRRMEACRQGDTNPCPHDCLDPRDVKFYRNQGGYHWDLSDDPFTWRDRIPFARVGFAEMIIFSLIFVGAAIGLWFVHPLLSIVPALLELEIIWFFRDPKRVTPSEPGLVVSPADGKIDVIEYLDQDDVIGGPAVKIAIFLSVFNVHINRFPVDAQVFKISHRKGKFKSATSPECALINEQLELFLESTDDARRVMRLRQITGAIARRIVCWVAPGDSLKRGQQLGMIKLGSRTELVIPQEQGLEILVELGDKVQAGETLFAKYA